MTNREAFAICAITGAISLALLIFIFILLIHTGII
jgi:hypothetical protein